MNRKIFAVSVITLLLDQITKILVTLFLKVGESINIIPNFFSLHYLENYGAAWSLFDEKIELLILVSIVALFLLIRYMNHFKKNTRNTIAFGLIVGGITGNLIDRVFLGMVRDFLSFQLLMFNYPIFNIADMGIVIGVILLSFGILKGEDRSGKNCS